MNQSWSIRRRLPAALVAVLAAVVVALVTTSYSAVRGRTLDAVEERLVRLATQLGRGGDTAGSRETLNWLRGLAASPRVVEYLAGTGSGEEARAALDDAVAAAPESSGLLGLWSADGALLVEVPAGSYGTLASVAPLPGDSATIGELRALDDTTLFYDATAPVRENGRLVGTVVSRTRARDSTREAAQAILGPSGHLLIGNASGSLWTDGTAVVEAPADDAAAASTEPRTYVRAGERRIGVAAAYPGRPWTVLVEIAEADALGPARDFLRRILGMALALVALGGVGAWVVGRSLTTRLDGLVGAVSGIAAGDYSTRVDVQPPAEMARLAEAVNTMAERIEGHTEQLEAGQSRLRSLVNATAQMVWFTDAGARVQGPLPSWQAYTGQSEEDISAGGWTEAVHPADRARFQETWARALRTQGSFELECRIRGQDGEDRLFLVRGVPVRADDGSTREWVGTCTDVEGQREAERELRRAEAELRQAQKMEAIGRLAGGVAHDFNNILTGILASTDFARAHATDDPRLTTELEEIRMAARRAAELTRQLLTISRSRSLNQRVLDLNEVVREASGLLERVIGEQIRVEVSLGVNVARVRAEQVHLEQIILNLAVNARDAMPHGGRLTLETSNVRLGPDYVRKHPSVRPGSYVMLAVSDTGVGMDASTLERIFEPFFTTKKEGVGTGLGLATVHGIVQQAGGHVWAYSEPEEGTTFKIYLPVAEGEPAASEGVAPTTDSVVGGSEVVLVVEDDDSVRRVSVRTLTSYGYEVLQARDGREGLEIVRARDDIGLVVTDMVMPVMSGPELAVCLRDEAPHLPVLFLSGYAAAAAVGRERLRGDEAFLQKPFTPAELAAAARGVIDAGRPED